MRVHDSFRTRPGRLARAVGALTLLAALGSPAEARKLGTADLLSGPQRCGGAECYEIEVTCPGVAAPATAMLRVRTPTAEAADRGTIYLATGGGGGALYGDTYGRPARQMIKKLVGEGFRTVEVKWLDLWLDGSPGELEGQARLACRPATAARWIYDNLHRSGDAAPFCATGNSGGSAQVSYMLSHYGLKRILSAVVPTAGPPMGRIDLGCLGEQDPQLPNMIYNRSPAAQIDRSFGFLNGDGPCSNADTSFRRRLRKASIAARKARRYVYPKTMVWLIFGEDDLGSAVGQGMLFFEKLEEAGTPLLGISVLPGTPHRTPSVRDGAREIQRVLLEACTVGE